MKTMIFASALALSAAAFAAGKTYQVTGPVLDVTETTFTVDKNGEQWEIQKDTAMVVDGELKKGSKVTVKYHMVADKVDAKENTKATKKK